MAEKFPHRRTFFVKFFESDTLCATMLLEKAHGFIEFEVEHFTDLPTG